MAPERPQIIIITGISGAGKSSVLRCFEDMGYFTIDNLPPPLMDKFIEVFYSSGSDIKGVALVMDVRGGAFFTDTINVLESLKKAGYEVKIIFLDAQEELLIRRFKEARRPHPLGGVDGVVVGLARERAALHELKQQASTIIDTTGFTLSQLRSRVMSIMSTDDDHFPLRVRI
ncbi:MAG: RNase adapter RapZ, partial [bacterium]